MSFRTAIVKVPPISIVAHIFRDPSGFVTKARKFLIALLAALAVLATALSDGIISPSEWIQIGVAFVGALGVYQLPNGN